MKTHIEKDVHVGVDGSTLVLIGDRGMVRLSADGLLALTEYARGASIVRTLIENRGGFPGSLTEAQLDHARDEGYDVGREEGYAAGKSDGRDEGYNSGFEDGKKEAAKAPAAGVAK